MALSKQQLDKNRQKKMIRRKDRMEKQTDSRSLHQLTPKIERALREAYGLMEDKQYDEAIDKLTKLDTASPNHPVILEALSTFHASLQNGLHAVYFAKKLVLLRPTSPRALFLCGETAVMAGMICQAVVCLTRCVTDWPGSDEAAQAAALLMVTNEERLKRLSAVDLPEAEADEVVQLHEDSLIALGQQDFKTCVQLYESVIGRAPAFIPGHNNLAIALWQMGECDRAIRVLQKASLLPNCNSFTKSLLAKYCLTSDRIEDANRFANELIAVPLNYADAALPICELLAMLGRDEDLLRFIESNATSEKRSMRPEDQSGMLHYHAYANCRLGNVAEAKRLWTASVKFAQVYPEAMENLEQLRQGVSNAPWPVPLTSWLPTQAIELLREKARDQTQANDREQIMHSGFDRYKSMFPALLERGDPAVRQLILLWSRFTKKPENLDLLLKFAQGKWGSDSDRMSAVAFLNEQSMIPSGTTLIYSRGKQVEVELFMPKITSEPIRESSDPVVNSLCERAAEMQRQGRLDESERLYEQSLRIHPNYPVALHNRCILWVLRDGPKGRSRAISVLEQLLLDFPDYNFAKLSIAGLIYYSGGMQRAKDLCREVLAAPVLHTTEASAVFRLQMHMAVTEKDYESAGNHYRMIESFSFGDPRSTADLKAEMISRFGRQTAEKIFSPKE